MDSLTDTVTSSVTSSAKEMAGTAMDSASNEAIKRALDIKEGGSNKQAIKDKLGAPVTTKTEAGLEVWTYDLSALNKVSPMLAETSKTLFKDAEAAQKNVVIKFEGETVKTLNLADKAKA
jgi:outer membrane protein assembly factor BamE (lipoprotein component of BamABCDE complex)